MGIAGTLGISEGNARNSEGLGNATLPGSEGIFGNAGPDGRARIDGIEEKKDTAESQRS